MHASLFDWSFEPTVCVALLAAVAGYALLWRRGVLRTDNDVSAWLPAAALRPWLFGAAMLTAVLALCSPIDRIGDFYLFWMHMVQHMLLMMVLPPLALLSLCGMRALRVNSSLRRVFTGLTNIWVAAVVFNGTLLLWHLPALYNTALTDTPLHVLEHVTFVAAGIIFWWPIVEPIRDADRRGYSPLTKIAMLGGSGIPPTVLGFVFSMAAPLYSFYLAAPRLWGTTPVSDQQIAAIIMLGVGNVIYFAAISVIFIRMFGDPSQDESDASAAYAG